LEETVEKVVKKCEGLPLTLEVMGCHLKDHQSDPMAWKQTLDILSKAKSVDGSCDDRLWTTLKVMYDMLGYQEKQMFLEAAAFFFKEEVEHVLWGWSTTYNAAEMRWSNLLKKSLVKEVITHQYDNINYCWVARKEIWVHEQLRDLAKRLSKGAFLLHQVTSGDLESEFHGANVVSRD
jgi:hypothetical protein